jgi:hypothetical protein
MMPMAVWSGIASHKIRRSLVIKASRHLRRVPGRSTVVEDIKELRPLQTRKSRANLFRPAFPFLSLDA